MKRLFFSLLTFCCLSAFADTVTEDFESVTLVNADSYGRATELSNGWLIQGGYISTSKDSYDYGFWTTAYNGSAKSLTAQYGSSNNAYVIIPVLLTGDVTFYYRKTSSDSRSAGKVYAYKVTENNGTYTVGTRIFMDESATSSWQQCTSIHLAEPTMIAFKMVRAAMDDVVYNTASLEPHEHSYASEWSFDENEHWHACTSEVGICDAKKIDVAAHDGLTCSVCGYKTPGVEAYPWTEDFEGITSGIPAGWDNSEGTTTTASYKWNLYSSYSEGKSLRFDSYNNQSGITNVLATPWLYIPETGTYELRFKCKNPKGGNYEVKIAEYGSDERVTLFDNLTNIASWTEKTANLADYAGKAVKIYFCGTSNWGSGDAYLYLDDVIVKERIEHHHDYAEEWSHELTNHWHACLSEIGECDAPKADFAAHTFDADNVCTVCGFERPFTEDFENGIPELWTNNGWEIANAPSYGNGTKMAYAGRYAVGNTLTTPRLLAKTGDVIEIEALLPWNDETLTMEYSTDEGETWNVAFAETPAANNTLCTLSWTAPADGIYLLRFSGRYNYIDNVCGFKLAPTEVEASDMTINRWATLCYPAEVELTGDAQAFRVTSVTDGAIEITEVGTSIPASTPVLLFSPEHATLELPATAHVINTTEPIREDGNMLVGCYYRNVLNKNTQYVLQKQDDVIAFYRINPATPFTATPYRCYLELAGGSASKLLINWNEGTTTAVASIEAADTDVVYDLNGRKVQHLQKGQVYIVGNKKITVK